MEVKVSFLSMFLGFILGKLKAWLIGKNQVEIERQKQQDESNIISETQELAQEADQSADEIDRIAKSH